MKKPSRKRSKLGILSTLLMSAGAITISFSAGNSHAADCQVAQQLKQQAVSQAKANHLDQAFETIQKSINLCDNFSNWTTLGGIEKARGNKDAAASAYAQAKQFAETREQSHLALARYAEMMGELGHPHLGASLLYATRKDSPEVADWIIELNKKLDLAAREKKLSSHQLTRALDTRAYSNLGVNKAPAINLQLNFKHNSTEPVDNSRFDVSTLAAAFSDAGLENKRFALVGHTDSTGPEQYNDELSRERAEYIYNKLIAMDAGLKDRLSVKGAGEGALLYENEKDDTEKMLNRRLEVQLLD